MNSSFSHSQIEGFKREAKQLVRLNGLTHSAALDQIAGANGHSNWSLLMKHNSPPDSHAGKRAPQPMQFVRSPDAMRLSMRKVTPTVADRGKNRIDVAKDQVPDISRQFVSPLNVVDYAIAYMTEVLAVPRYKVYAASPIHWEMQFWLPYASRPVEGDKHILLNRNYKPAGQVSNDWAIYENFPHLHFPLASSQYDAFTSVGSTDGFLFNDGCTPWSSREHAIDYLERLRALRQVLLS